MQKRDSRGRFVRATKCTGTKCGSKCKAALKEKPKKACACETKRATPEEAEIALSEALDMLFEAYGVTPGGDCAVSIAIKVGNTEMTLTNG